MLMKKCNLEKTPDFDSTLQSLEKHSHPSLDNDLERNPDDVEIVI